MPRARTCLTKVDLQRVLKTKNVSKKILIKMTKADMVTKLKGMLETTVPLQNFQKQLKKTRQKQSKKTRQKKPKQPQSVKQLQQQKKRKQTKAQRMQQTNDEANATTKAQLEQKQKSIEKQKNDSIKRIETQGENMKTNVDKHTKQLVQTEIKDAESRKEKVQQKANNIIKKRDKALVDVNKSIMKVDKRIQTQLTKEEEVLQKRKALESRLKEKEQLEEAKKRQAAVQEQEMNAAQKARAALIREKQREGQKMAEDEAAMKKRPNFNSMPLRKMKAVTDEQLNSWRMSRDEMNDIIGMKIANQQQRLKRATALAVLGAGALLGGAATAKKLKKSKATTTTST